MKTKEKMFCPDCGAERTEFSHTDKNKKGKKVKFYECLKCNLIFEVKIK